MDDRNHVWRSRGTGKIAPALIDAISALARIAHRQQLDGERLRAVLVRVDAEPAGHATGLARVIGRALNTVRWSPIPKPTGLVEQLKTAWRAREPTLPTPEDLAWFSLCDPDGFVRERALEGINMPPPSAIRLALLMIRLNDWVPQVRAAAQRCLDRVGAGIAPEVFVDTLPYCLQALPLASRMGDGGAALIALVSRPDIHDLIADRLMNGEGGAIVRIFRDLMSTDLFDAQLPALAASARNTAIRARALRILLAGAVEDIPVLREFWISRTLGIKRPVAGTATRPIDQAAAAEALISRAARDRTVAVRKAAAQGLVRHRNDVDDLDALVALFDTEKNPAILDRIAFVKKSRPA
ncbi:hypothetical protein [Pararhizobium antarcticum]|uniref:Uncharacterized protein n=1 Tax=Pararhizobium antarcticum TaxID=1798805 RepID=A0A657LW52_9HYPH|nr:hypothetical protein [Pararhizobium antarcticum]OJF92865.1 hypothetical protein AX761_20710 [Rhizobium sp. 58]OJF98752.1 hypothetical protein AX760_01580 [Pararhizobium antarcticum]OJF98860.1 hypothetical protein AX760_02230 [Pararhizobium antarcticum]